MSLFVLALILLGGAILFSFIGVTISRKFNKGVVNEGHNEVIAPIFATAGVIYAVLIGALVIAVWENYDSAKGNAAEEASILTTMYRETSGMPAAEQKIMREHLTNYTEKVINEEWALQVHGGASTNARNEVVALFGEYGKMDPALASAPINVDFLSNLKDVADHRNKRTLQSQEHLSGLLWFIIFLSSIIVITMSFFVYMEKKWPHVFISCIFSFLIGSLLLVTIVFDSPFSGALAIDPGSFEHSLSVYKSVDQPGK